jgi:recombination protein RecT
MDFKESLSQLKQPVAMSQYLTTEGTQAIIAKTIGKEGVQKFVSDVITMCNITPALRKCEPVTVLMGALHGTVLNLNWQNGEFWLVPYEDRKNGTTKAQFQIGKAGMIQLCQRTNMFTKIRTSAIKKGEIITLDHIQGEYKFKMIEEGRDKLETVGYYAYFTLVNNARYEDYWSKEKVLTHATEYSQAFKTRTGNSPWLKHFDKMAENVVLYHLLKRYAPKSRDFATAQRTNQSVLHDPDGVSVEYIDNPKSNGIKIIRNDAPKHTAEDVKSTIDKAVKDFGTKKVYEDIFSGEDEKYPKDAYESLPYTPTMREIADKATDDL